MQHGERKRIIFLLRLKEQFAPHTGDEEVIAIIGNEEVAHALVRSQAVVYQDSGPTLSAQEAHGKGLVVVLTSKTQRLKALRQGNEVPRENVLETKERNRALCAQSPECTAMIETFTENYGMSVEDYWGVVPYEKQHAVDGSRKQSY